MHLKNLNTLNIMGRLTTFVMTNTCYKSQTYRDKKSSNLESILNRSLKCSSFNLCGTIILCHLFYNSPSSIRIKEWIVKKYGSSCAENNKELSACLLWRYREPSTSPQMTYHLISDISDIRKRYFKNLNIYIYIYDLLLFDMCFSRTVSPNFYPRTNV